ncbi:hypothetical protein BEWA_047380 [Theileria equi strain WA]|uniref:Uncharacterized protein n=1 Tax=Theileria equi strain WA TaxID=1537102 RepID=L1LAW8_THEEQ|nr:hypothetical protein BEWA_047380 [Theileria equi strain WA]EKX72273.1 hypothetical protein BEWA_047380 [Theileria equi strain WA]|eukprot:XP_004831725.1 hypothetical protein BEWA_047380 [Theileria equi strain WA]
MTPTTVAIDVAKRAEAGEDGVRLDDSSNRCYYLVGDVKVFLTSTYPEDSPGYEKVTHTPEGAKIRDIMHNRRKYNISSTTLSTVSVYYWVYDREHENPLLIELGDRTSCYAVEHSDSLKNVNSLSKYSLIQLLDGFNCIYNNAHNIDLSRIHDYVCIFEGCREVIAVNSTPFCNYIKHSHSIPHKNNGFKISALIYRGKRAMNIPIPAYAIKSFSVYYSTCDVLLSYPLIVEFEQAEENGYEFYKIGGELWKVVPMKEGPSSSEENNKILKETLDDLMKTYFSTHKGEKSHINASIIVAGIAGGIASAGLLCFVALSLVPHAKTFLKTGKALL